MRQAFPSLLFLFGLALSASASGSASDTLSAAQALLRERHFDEAIGRIQPLLDALRLDTVEEIILAHRILGVAYCETGDPERAKEHFQSLVAFSPNDDLTDLAPSRSCLDLYQKTRIPPLPAEKKARTLAAAATPVKASKSSIPPESDGGAGLRWIPFGVGQYANQESEKGLAFALGEGTLFATSIAAFALFEAERNSDGTFESPGKADAYKALFWSSLGAGTGVAIWGVVDALLTYREKNLSNNKSPTARIGVQGPFLAIRF